MINNQNKQGFTLVELSVVIVIIGILLAAGLKLFTAQAESAAYSATQKKIDAIKIALSTHLRVNRRLPCPDVGPGGVAPTVAAPFDGVEDRLVVGDVNSQCLASFGIVPFATLGLPQGTVVDAWDSFISYRVFYNAGLNIDDSTRSGTFRTGNLGGLRIENRYPANSAATTIIVNNAVIVLISHGKNSLGAWSSKSTRNTLPNAAFDEFLNTQFGNYIKRDYSDDENAVFGPFDDIVEFMTPNDLLSPLIQDGSFKSPESTVNSDMVDIRSKLLGYIAANNKNSTVVAYSKLCAPPPLLLDANVIHISDPWGTNYAYGLEPITPTPPPAAAMALSAPFVQITSTLEFRDSLGGTIPQNRIVIYVASAGPDRLFSSVDDPAPLAITGMEILNFLGPTWIGNNCL